LSESLSSNNLLERLFSKGLLFFGFFYSHHLLVDWSARWRDSYGTSGQVETPKGVKRQEAHRTPRGKRAAWSEGQLLSKATIYVKTTFRNEPKKKAVFKIEHCFYFFLKNMK
jgi:hypothetical protein